MRTNAWYYPQNLLKNKSHQETLKNQKKESDFQTPNREVQTETHMYENKEK